MISPSISAPATEKPRVVLHGLPDRYPVKRAEPLREDADAGTMSCFFSVTSIPRRLTFPDVGVRMVR